MNGDITTLNFRVSSVAEVSTRHRYLFKDKRTGMCLYFDDVRVFGGVVNEVKFYRGEDRDRAGLFNDTDTLPESIVEALKYIEENGEFPTRDEVLSIQGFDDITEAAT